MELFVITRSLICNSQLFHCKVFVGLVWLIRNHMFGSGNLWDKLPSGFLKFSKLPLFYSGEFTIFRNALGNFTPNRPPKHVITSTYYIITFFHWGINTHWPTYFLKIFSTRFFQKFGETSAIYCFFPPQVHKKCPRVNASFYLS